MSPNNDKQISKPIRNGSTRAMRLLKAVWATAVLFVTVVTIPSTALSSGLIILYPEVRKPYMKIYQDIISGIVEEKEKDVHAVAIAPGKSLAAYRRELSRLAPDNIIALGLNSVGMARDFNLELPQALPLIAGAVVNPDIEVAGISMIPDTQVIIDKLVLLYGDVKNIHLVASSARRGDELRRASDYAATKNINFVIHPADTPQEAASQYKKLLANVKQYDAIWLRRDKAINNTGLLSKVLEVAWSKKVAVFSSNPTHVKRGALFSIYPNNKKLGVSLARLAENNKNTNDVSKTISPLQDVYTVVNDRTRRHLGISLSRDERSAIDSFF